MIKRLHMYMAWYDHESYKGIGASEGEALEDLYDTMADEGAFYEDQWQDEGYKTKSAFLRANDVDYAVNDILLTQEMFDRLPEFTPKG